MPVAIAKCKVAVEQRDFASVSEAARHHGMVRKTLDEWVKAGRLSFRDGRIHSADVVAAYEKLRVEREAALKAATDTKGKKGDATERWKTARAKKLEMEVRQLQGQLVETASVVAVLRQIERSMRAALSNLPPRLSVELQGAEAGAIEAALKRELDRALNTVAAEVQRFELKHPKG